MRLLVFLLTMACFSFDLQAQNEDHYSSLEFRNIGPFRGGRASAVTGVPGKPMLYYFGSSGGGVWKTKDGGQTWTNISDGFFGGSIGAVAVSESNNNIIYVGGGEKTVRGNVSYGYGVWKTTDGGKSWEQVGLKNSRHISRIRIDKTNPDIVYAAVMGDLFKDTQERGVYKSTDGGKNWKKVLFANAGAGAVDLSIDSGNPRVMFASTWKIRRTPYSLESGGEGSALWRSTDAGETWTDISAGAVQVCPTNLVPFARFSIKRSHLFDSTAPRKKYSFSKFSGHQNVELFLNRKFTTRRMADSMTPLPQTRLVRS